MSILASNLRLATMVLLQIMAHPDYTPTASFAQMQNAPLSSPPPVPVGEKCGAVSWAFSWSGFRRQAMPPSAVSADLAPKPVTPDGDSRLQMATEV
jgi:hypothetical protein